MVTRRYSYKSYPNCPEATEYSKNRASTAAQLGGLIVLFSLGAALWLVFVSIEFFNTNNWTDFIGTMVFAILMAVIDFYYFVVRDIITEREIKKILIKSANPNIASEDFELVSKNFTRKVVNKYFRLQKSISDGFSLVWIALIVFIGVFKEIF